KKAKKEAETWVFWDLNSCPVPKDCDARLVGSSIESALKKAGHCEGHLYHLCHWQPQLHLTTKLSCTSGPLFDWNLSFTPLPVNLPICFSQKNKV
ncbi:unnamed protein product, partial [Brassica oleracea]